MKWTKTRHAADGCYSLHSDDGCFRIDVVDGWAKMLLILPKIKRDGELRMWVWSGDSVPDAKKLARRIAGAFEKSWI